MKKYLSHFKRVSILLLIVTLSISMGCEEKKEKQPPLSNDTITVKKPEPPKLKVVFGKEAIKSTHILAELTDRFGDTGMRQILAVNRLDTRHIVIGDTLCVPDTLPA